MTGLVEAFKDDQQEWKMRRVAIKVDGKKLDVWIRGKPSTFANGRWTLFSLGNTTLIENVNHAELLTQLNSNAIYFNYPGFARSQGSAGQKSAVRAYRAVLRFLEDKTRGLGAREVIAFGHSIGTAVQAKAYSQHQGEKDVKHVLVKYHPLSRVSDAAKKFVSPFVGKLVGVGIRFFGQEIDVVRCSEQEKRPEIILQNSSSEQVSVDSIQSDGIFAPKATLAYHLLQQQESRTVRASGTKHYVGISQSHNNSLSRDTLAQVCQLVTEELGKAASEHHLK